MTTLYEILTGKIASFFRVDARYFVSGAFWLLVAQGGVILGSLLTAVFLANTLTENSYGVYRYIIGLSAIFTAFSLTGLPQAVLQATAKGYTNIIELSTPITLKWSLGISFAGISFAAYYFFQDNSTLALGCLMIAVLHPFTSFFSNTIALYSGLSRFKTISHIHVVKSAFVSGSTLIALLFTQNITALLFVYFLTQAISAIAVHFIYKPDNAVKFQIPSEVWQNYFSYAKHTSIRGILLRVANNLDSIIVFQFLGAAQLAMFSIATLVPTQVRGTFKHLQTLLISKYSKHETIDSIRSSILTRSIQFFFLLLFITTVFIFIVPYIYLLLFPEYTSVIPLVQLLALSFPAYVFLIPDGALLSQRAERELYQSELSTSTAQIILLFFLTFYFGLLGAVASRVITQYLKAFISFYLIYKK